MFYFNIFGVSATIYLKLNNIIYGSKLVLIITLPIVEFCLLFLLIGVHKCYVANESYINISG